MYIHSAYWENLCFIVFHIFSHNTGTTHWHDPRLADDENDDHNDYDDEGQLNLFEETFLYLIGFDKREQLRCLR